MTYFELVVFAAVLNSPFPKCKRLCFGSRRSFTKDIALQFIKDHPTSRCMCENGGFIATTPVFYVQFCFTGSRSLQLGVL